ncbi:MAG: nucleoside phosphorylase [Alphaproteobacteria bacterium]|nr:nucleoside phosphorylase [Alphaproteobacteria bacterium]
MLQPHIRIDETHGAKYALLPGDPARLDRIIPFLTDVRELAYNREYRSISGIYKNVKVLAISTGIGGCSAGIAVEELARTGIRAMIRIGSCGAMQPGIGLGDLILAAGAVRDDGASQAYVDLRFPAIADTALLNACLTAARQNGFAHHVGIIHSHESFYIDDNEEQKKFWAKRGVLGADMETAALFTIGRLRGVKTASILNNVVICGTDTANSIGGYADGKTATAQGEKNEIQTALKAFVLLENQ